MDIYIIALIAFCISVLIPAWTYGLYPLTVRLLKSFYKPIKKSKGFFPSFSVLIPVYNEENSIKEKIENIRSLEYSQDKVEIIVVDDGSTDRTLEILEEFEDVKILRLKRSGKTAAINAGLKTATLDIVLLTDADCLLASDALLRAAEAFYDDSVGAVSGKTCLRNSKPSLVVKESSHISGSLIENESQLDSVPSGMGGFLAFRRKLVKMLNPECLADDVDISIKVRMAGYRIVYAPSIMVSTWDPDDFKTWYHQTVRRTLQGLTTLFHNKRVLFNPKYGWFGMLIFPTRLFLHRLTPFFLILGLISSLFISLFLSVFLLILLAIGVIFLPRIRKLFIIQFAFLNAWGLFLMGRHGEVWKRGARQELPGS